MVGDDLVAEPLALDGRRIVADEVGQPLDDRHEEIGPIVRVDPLQRARHALQAHAGVDTLERQRGQGSVGRPVELHKDQVPDLEPAGTGLGVVGDAIRSLAELRAAVVVDLATRPAWAGLGHLPEVVVVPRRDVAPPCDPLRRQADFLGPDLVRLVVIGVGGGGQPLWSDAEVVGQELPGPADRLALEVVTEAPVAEHLEEGLVARGAPDLLEVVVLARHPQAWLRVDGPGVVTLLLAGQHPLELDHPGVHEEQRRVVAGEERGGRNARVATLLEEALKSLADLGCGERLHRSIGRHAPIHQESRRRPAPVSIDECGSVSGLGGLQLAAGGSGLGTR